MLARKMHPAADGLNHQGAIAFVVDSASLQLIQNFGQTSGHSLDMMLTTTCNYQFLGVDLGDNFPRGNENVSSLLTLLKVFTCIRLIAQK